MLTIEQVKARVAGLDAAKAEHERMNTEVDNKPESNELQAAWDAAYERLYEAERVLYDESYARLAISLSERLAAAEAIMDDACKLWREIGHPMLLAAALELDDARKALAPEVAR